MMKARLKAHITEEEFLKATYKQRPDDYIGVYAVRVMKTTLLDVSIFTNTHVRITCLLRYGYDRRNSLGYSNADMDIWEFVEEDNLV